MDIICHEWPRTSSYPTFHVNKVLMKVCDSCTPRLNPVHPGVHPPCNQTAGACHHPHHSAGMSKVTSTASTFTYLLFLWESMGTTIMRQTCLHSYNRAWNGLGASSPTCLNMQKIALSRTLRNILAMLWIHSWAYTGKDWLHGERWQLWRERVAWKKPGRNKLPVPVVPQSVVIHSTVLPNPEWALLSPSRDSSHCLKYMCTNLSCSNLPINVGNVEDENTFLQHLNGHGLSPPSTAALSTAGAQFIFLLQSLLISVLKRGRFRHQLVDQWEHSISPLLRLGSPWTRQTRCEKNHSMVNLNGN